ncbi:hypothetical protein N8I74_16425 [Chitiniphilus purpureus]|uniref:Uncharacterized protein n=1 Tax=Chitiniphilus purpureus TaxID=2981137 RepID=A0ABY6DKK2_9NEIS|nr:hypothetical protein [Chitiniphilus sp. CD1]UXY14884.1 hypothetical protein N8I74_16425 [Chitiniphilus sp. CD1]
MSWFYVFIALCSITGFLHGMDRLAQQHRYWQGLPFLKQYSSRHPWARRNGAACCYKCGCDELLDVGLSRVGDYRRRIVCNQCRTPLWREEDEA